MGINISEIDDWQQLRSLRLQSLRTDPQAFGGTLEQEEMFSDVEWQKVLNTMVCLAADIDGVDIALMSVEKVKGDFGATCWVGGCWVAPEYRGKGVMRAFMSYVDQHAGDKGWEVQGLGVWDDNFSAITVYEKLGFVAKGAPQASTRVPGKFYQRMIRRSTIS